MNRLRPTLRSLLVIVWLCFSTHSAAASSQKLEVGYSYTNQQSGGIAIAQVDGATGRILKSRVVLDSSSCTKALKLRRAADGRLVVTNLNPDQPHLFIVDPSRTHPHRSVRLPSAPDELRIFGTRGVLSGEDDLLAVVDLQQGRTVRSWDVGNAFRPPANAPEDVLITRDQRHALVSFQKDSKKGKKFGSRIAVFELPMMKRVADLQLPRSRPELHIKGNLKQQGPGPEVLYVSPKTNTLLVTLDLYGAVGLMNWKSALSNEIKNWKLLSTATSGGWGNAFPDRGCGLSLAGRECFLVCNAGQKGGSVLVDLQQRAVVWKRLTPAGLEQPIFFPTISKAYSVCSGKTKKREKDDVSKTFVPEQPLFEFDFSSRDAIRNKPVKALPLTDEFAIRIVAARMDPPLLLIATGAEAERPTTLVTYDPVKQSVVDQQPAAGIIGRFQK